MHDIILNHHSLIGRRLSSSQFSIRELDRFVKNFTKNRTVPRVHEIRSRLPGRAPRALGGAQEIRSFFNS